MASFGKKCFLFLAIIDYRLPKNLKPNLYDLKIKPYIGSNREAWPAEKDFTFDGSVEIFFTCIEPTRRIVFHADHIQIVSIFLRSFSSDHQPFDDLHEPLSHEIDEVRTFAIVQMNHECVEHFNYSLSINYTGSINEELEGFYRSSYLDENMFKTKLEKFYQSLI